MDIETDIEAQVAIVTLNRPHKRNALGSTQLRRFGEICRELAVQEEVRAVVVTGAGQGFCSGADLSEFEALSSTPPPPVMGTDLDFITPLRELMKPTIAAVNGIAVGAGLGIALACDVRVCAASGAFLANFGALSLPATDAVTYFLPRLIGVSRALEMLYTGEVVDAAQAAEMGLVTHLVSDDELMDRALGLAREFASAPPIPTQLSKAMVMRSLDRSYQESLLAQEYGHIANFVYGKRREDG